MPTLLLNKPYGVLCQFTGEPGQRTLKEFVPVADVYPAGRLDADSEGLVVLTDDGALQARLSHPRHKLPKTYWVQVEGSVEQAALDRLCRGIAFSDFTTQPAQAREIEAPPQLWPRDPPIRVRKLIPTSWIEMTLAEGKNRQVRRMTAAVGLPALRLVRCRVGSWQLGALAPGEWREADMQGQQDD